MKTLNQLLSTPQTVEYIKNNVLLMEIKQYNLGQLVELMEKTKVVISEYKGKYIGKALRDKFDALQSENNSNYIYIRLEEYSATLNLRCYGVEYTESWDKEDNRIYGVFERMAEQEEIYVSRGFVTNRLTTQEILAVMVEYINQRIEGIKERIKQLQNAIDNYDTMLARKKVLQAEIAEREKEIKSFGLYFNEITKYV